MKYIKKVAVSPIPEINGSVVDSFNVEDKTTNAPSVNAVENYIKAQNTYSTEETFTGKYWVDGKKIYKRTLVGKLPSPDINGSNWVNIITTVSELVDVYGNVAGRPYNYLSVLKNGIYVLALDFATGGNTLMYRNLGYVENSDFKITVEYTKTTDV